MTPEREAVIRECYTERYDAIQQGVRDYRYFEIIAADFSPAWRYPPDPTVGDVTINRFMFTRVVDTRSGAARWRIECEGVVVDEGTEPY